MLKAEFEALVSSAINRGTAYNSFIPGAARRAMNWFERNWDFFYMKSAAFQAVNSFSLNSQNLGTRIKKIYDLYFINDQVDPETGAPLRNRPIKVASPDIITYMQLGAPRWPEFYYILNSSLSGFNEYTAIFGTSTWPGSATIFWDKYDISDYDGLSASTHHWLLTFGEDAMLAKTMLNLIPFIRQPEKQTFWQEQFTMALPTLIQLAERQDDGEGASVQMEYS